MGRRDTVGEVCNAFARLEDSLQSLAIDGKNREKQAHDEAIRDISRYLRMLQLAFRNSDPAVLPLAMLANIKDSIILDYDVGKGANDLRTLCQRAVKIRKMHGFETPNSIQNHTLMLAKLALLTSEIGEAVEAVRKHDSVAFTEEIADLFIRLMDIAGSMNINIEREICKKMDINAGREKSHGKLM